MRRIDLLPVGDVRRETLEALGDDLTALLHVRCDILNDRFDPVFARHGERGQFDSSQILARLRVAHDERRNGPASDAAAWRLLGVTSLDLYIPILTFVFGEAEIGGSCAIVSTHRLAQPFYGLPADPALERERLLKEAVHELGHTFQLMHCEDYRCVMAPSHSVEWIDVKQPQFCDDCSNRMFAKR